jgi:hypothetical protein
MISIKITATPDAITRMRERGPEILAAITEKMNALMIALQNKVLGTTIPRYFKSAPNISSSVQLIPAQLAGQMIVGGVTAGGPRTTTVTKKSGAQVDYAAVQEYGVGHSYEILPFDKKALAFLLDGKQIITKRVFHPPLAARPFMRDALAEMTPEITEGLQSAVREALSG